MCLSSAPRCEPREMSQQNNLHGSPAMSWLYQGAGELLPLHHLCRLICSPLLNLPLSPLEMSKISINRRKRVGVLKASKLTAPISNTTHGHCTSCLDPTLQERCLQYRDHRVCSPVPATKCSAFSPGVQDSPRRAPERCLCPLSPVITPPGSGFLGGCWKPSCQETELLFTDVPFSYP